MNDSRNNEGDIPNEELRPHIEKYVDLKFGKGTHIQQIGRMPINGEVTTAKCDILKVELSTGEILSLFLKKYGQRIRRSVNSRQWRLAKNEREVFAYREVLPLIDVGSPALVGAAVGKEEEKEWLLIEFVDGKKVGYFGDLKYWYVVAAWQAKFHKEQQSIEDQNLRARAFKIDYQHFDDMANEMYDGVRDSFPVLSQEARALKDRVHCLAEVLLDAPLVWMHGAFTELNLLIRSGHAGLSSDHVCPIDWEWIGLGPRLFDLSRISHGYGLKHLDCFIESYRNEAQRLDIEVQSASTMLVELYRFRAYWWCRRVRDLIAWNHPSEDIAKIISQSARDASAGPE